MFKSRYTVAVSIIVLYFLPLLFLSLYGMNAMGSQKTWEFFSFGLFFAIAGSLIIFSLLIQFETNIDLESDSDDEVESDVDSIADLDAIIVNLNEELTLKTQEIQYLARDNFNLKHRIEEIEEQLQASLQIKHFKDLPPEKKENPSDIMENSLQEFEELEPIEDLKETLELEIQPIAPQPQIMDYITPHLKKREEPAPLRENRVEVTRL